MKVDEVVQCSLPEWYPLFENYTIESTFIKLPDEFIEYLQSDGIQLPKGSQHGIHQRSSYDSDANSEEEEEKEKTKWLSEDSDENEKAPDFPDIEQKIYSAVELLGGAVFPKLNWSAPKDATWVAFGNSLKCTCPGDIFLLLKSSDFINHDLNEAFSTCEDGANAPPITFNLVLRRWMEIAPGDEFRCFVKSGQLIGICTRNCNEWFDKQLREKESIEKDIVDFFKKVICGKFPLKNYVFDVCRKSKGDVLLLDFNPFDSVTDSLMFTWQELEDNRIMEERLPLVRIQDAVVGIEPSPYGQYSLPQDILDLTRGGDPDKLIDLLQLQSRQQEGESDSE